MTSEGSRSCLYRGRVMHHRLRPVRHRFTYRVFSLHLDLDELAALDRRLRLFSVERWNLLSFRNADHGARDGSPLAPWVLDRLAAAGIRLARPRVTLLCFPRVLGYAFNPLSVYFCHDGERLAAVLYEVKNTFGEQHVYAFPVRHEGYGPRLAAHGCPKAFYVSPFLPMTTSYRFRLEEPGRRLVLVIEAAEHGRPVLVASQIGARETLDDRTIVRCLVGNLLMTFKVTLGIHIEALRLWRKGAPFFPKRKKKGVGEPRLTPAATRPTDDEQRSSLRLGP
jgi:DUF1365 family protein